MSSGMPPIIAGQNSPEAIMSPSAAASAQVKSSHSEDRRVGRPHQHDAHLAADGG